MQDVEELLNTVLSRETLAGLNLLLAVRKVMDVLSASVFLTLFSDGRGDLLPLLFIVKLRKDEWQDEGKRLRPVSNSFICTRLSKR